MQTIPDESKQLTFKVQVVYADDIQERWEALGHTKPVKAFAYWGTADNGWCVIYTKKPRSAEDTDRLVSLGHELLHCTDFNYHKGIE